jgi:ABC-type transport system involved in multi-copper enzyme maturation permease subunit
VWIVAILLISAKVSSVISGERGRQTLEVLLTTPLTGRDIVRQHYHGILKLLLVLALPILTCYPLRWFYAESVEQRPEFQLVYVFSSVAGVLIYLPLCAWISMLVGLRIRSPIKAMLTTIAGLAFWIVVPVFLSSTSIRGQLNLPVPLALAFGLFIAGLVVRTQQRAGADAAIRAGVLSVAFIYSVMASAFKDPLWIFSTNFLQEFTPNKRGHNEPGFYVFLSPAVLTVHQERSMVRPGTVLLNFAWFGFLLFAVRGICLSRADAWLGRATSLDDSRGTGAYRNSDSV